MDIRQKVSWNRRRIQIMSTEEVQRFLELQHARWRRENLIA